MQVTAKNVGLPNHIKVWHDNTGRQPDWFLEYIRIRKRESFDRLPPRKGTPGGAGGSAVKVTKAGGAAWVVFPCGRWFSTQLDDSRISRVLFAGHSTPLIQYKVRQSAWQRLLARVRPGAHSAYHNLGSGTRSTACQCYSLGCM